MQTRKVVSKAANRDQMPKARAFQSKLSAYFGVQQKIELKTDQELRVEEKDIKTTDKTQNEPKEPSNRRQKRARTRTRSKRLQKKAEKTKKRRFPDQSQIIAIDTSLICAKSINSQTKQENQILKESKNIEISAKLLSDEKENFKTILQSQDLGKPSNNCKIKGNSKNVKKKVKKVKKATKGSKNGKKGSKKKETGIKVASIKQTPVKLTKKGGTEIDNQVVEKKPNKRDSLGKNKKKEPENSVNQDSKKKPDTEVQNLKEKAKKNSKENQIDSKLNGTTNLKKLTKNKNANTEILNGSSKNEPPKIRAKTLKSLKSQEKIEVTEKSEDEENNLVKRRGKCLKLGRRIRKKRKKSQKTENLEKSKKDIKKMDTTQKDSEKVKLIEKPLKKSKKSKNKKEKAKQNKPTPNPNPKSKAKLKAKKPAKIPKKPSVKSKKSTHKDMLAKKQSILKHAQKYRTLDLFFASKTGAQNKEIDQHICRNHQNNDIQVIVAPNKSLAKDDQEISVLVIEQDSFEIQKHPSEIKILEATLDILTKTTQADRPTKQSPIIQKSKILEINTPNQKTENKIIVLENSSDEKAPNLFKDIAHSESKIAVYSSQEFNRRCLLMKRNDKEANFTPFKKKRPLELDVDVETQTPIELELPVKSKKLEIKTPAQSVVKPTIVKKKKKSLKRVKEDKKSHGKVAEVKKTPQISKKPKHSKTAKAFKNGAKGRPKTAKKKQKSNPHKEFSKKSKRSKKSSKSKRVKKLKKKFDDDEEIVNSEGWSRKSLIELLERIVKINKQKLGEEGLSKSEIFKSFIATGFKGSEEVLGKMLDHLAEKDKIFLSEKGEIYVI